MLSSIYEPGPSKPFQSAMRDLRKSIAIAGRETNDLPSDLLDNLTNEGSALAQVSLGAGDTGLDGARSRLL
jgi:hypothetical protein